MKILTVSDLHQRRHLYEQLASAISEHRPDLVCIIGDWLDYEGGDMTPPEAAAVLAKATGECEVAFSPGNHELFEVEFGEFERAWKDIRPFNLLSRRPGKFGRLIVMGFPAFACDEWEDWLVAYVNMLGDHARVLWLMHEPPTSELAEEFFRCEDWHNAILTYGPLIVVSGHDHNTPLERGAWECKVGKTTCVNVGQRAHTPGGKLCYCTFRIEFLRECGVGCGLTPYLRDLRRHG